MSADHGVGDPMMIRFKSLLIRFLYAAALLGPPLPGPYLLTQRPCLDLRCQALTYLLTYEAAMLAAELTRELEERRGDFGDETKLRVNPLCFSVSVRAKFLFSRRPRTFLWLN